MNEKKMKSKAEGERLNLQVIGCINNQLGRLPDWRTKQRILAYIQSQVEDEAKLEKANRLAQLPYPTTNGTAPKQQAMFPDE